MIIPACIVQDRRGRYSQQLSL
uniref:Uncharacterized protein n=1 Tax=Anguilla anguilla TaxID=7936 RepID=A0A0E9V4E5_ANGAN